MISTTETDSIPTRVSDVFQQYFKENNNILISSISNSNFDQAEDKNKSIIKSFLAYILQSENRTNELEKIIKSQTLEIESMKSQLQLCSDNIAHLKNFFTMYYNRSAPAPTTNINQQTTTNGIAATLPPQLAPLLIAMPRQVPYIDDVPIGDSRDIIEKEYFKFFTKNLKDDFFIMDLEYINNLCSKVLDKQYVIKIITKFREEFRSNFRTELALKYKNDPTVYRLDYVENNTARNRIREGQEKFKKNNKHLMGTHTEIELNVILLDGIQNHNNERISRVRSEFATTTTTTGPSSSIATTIIIPPPPTVPEHHEDIPTSSTTTTTTTTSTTTTSSTTNQ
ncbi:hypothetical protein PPL_01365 [Heterostelium album PN500]|uniref:Uncharacterized protein n=1 Tax=Heterostelium pallidum (strain ATCC 26659 / Pp 5 / PN500) TaxID=670386 RepID=D3AZ25_HETP5|nr:hypothetical protein PPL_01365 [Heterostelium album PN500]EFA85582.1 hypothetical protein PPL_01365 [Heterostelium album PN500]|eukprot:XP_020437689.1 hypothetical protein PPL_01365 [Heterostelium album PN500]